MGSIQYLTLASVLDSFQASQIISGGTRQQTPLVDTTWSYDGDPATRLEIGTNDGVTPTWTSGSVYWDLSNHPGLASGQAVGFVVVDIGGGSGYTVGNEVQVFIENTNTAGSHLGYWVPPGGFGSFYPTGAIGRAAGFDWRTDINALRMTVNGYRAGSGSGATNPVIATFGDLRLAAYTYNRPTLTVAALGTVTTTLRPTVSWTFSRDTLGSSYGSTVQGQFRVRVFTAAQYGAGGFDPATSASTLDSGIVSSAANSYQLPSNLVNGTTYRAYVIAAQTLPVSGYQHWTTDGTTWAALGAAAYTQFTISTAPPPVPTLITPASGSTVTTDIPTYGATLGASSVSGATVRAEWQLATDAGFTNNVRTITEPVGDLRTSGATTQAGHVGVELFQGTWYIRARELDSLGVYGSYSAAHTFTVSHPPTSTAHNPTGQQTVKYGATTTFAWQFSDTSPFDAQTAFQLIVERDDTGVVQYDSGKQVSPAQSFAVALSSALKGVLLRWKVRVYDSDDVVGAYSANQQFYVRDPGTIAHVVPTSGGVIDNPQPTLSWTYTGSGYSQQSFRVQISETSPSVGAVYDSGFITSLTTSHALPSPMLVTGHAYSLTLTIRDNFGIESSSTIAFTALWVPPPAPDITVNIQPYDEEDGGYVEVSWPQNRDVNFVNYKIYRRGLYDLAWTLVGTTTDTIWDTYFFNDRTAPANKPAYWAVTQTALRFGQPVESSIPTLVTDTSVEFSGTQYVTYTLPSTPGDVTACVWCRPTSLAAGAQAVVAFNTGAGGNSAEVFWAANGFSRFCLFHSTPDTFLQEPTARALDQWYHVAIVVSGTTSTLYVNGVQAQQATGINAVNIPVSGASLNFGQEFDEVGVASNRFHGGMDEAMYFNRALTASEVAELANLSRTETEYVPYVLALAPFAWWRLGAADSGSTAVDSSGNARNAAYVGTPTFGLAGVIASTPLYTPVSEHYWLVPTESSEWDSLRLSMVISDQLADEWEREELLLLGRGRRVERGTRWGIRGSLTAQVRDGVYSTAVELMEAVDTIVTNNSVVYLRTPFGQVYKVALGDVQKDRLPGVGVQEFVNLSFDYVEVA